MDQPKKSTKLRSFSIVSTLTLVSRITGLGRDSLMASLFGTGWILDAFSLAFRVPNMFRRLFGEGAMTAAFLPEFVRIDQAHGRAAADALFCGVGWRLLKILFGFCLATEAAVALFYLTMSMSDRTGLLCELTMLLIPFMLLICMSGFYSAALNGVHHFTFPALAPVVLNLTWLSGGLIAARCLLTGPAEARWIAISIVAGGALQLAMLIWKAGRFSIRLKPPAAEAVTQAKVVFQAMAPVLIGLSIAQINGIVDSLLAWVLSSGNIDRIPELYRFRLPEGTAGALYLGQRLYQFPMGVFAVALGTILFPRFAKHAQAKNFADLNTDVIHGIQLVLVVGIPASAGLWLMAGPITDLLFRYGQFDAIAASMTTDMIAAHGLGVWVFSGLLIVNRVYYAANDQMTPMRQGLMCVGLNLIFDIVLLPILGATALPIASVLATTFQLGVAVEGLRKRFLTVGRSAFIPILWRVILCTMVMYLVTQYALQLVHSPDDVLTMWHRLVAVTVPILAAAVTYAAGLIFLGVSPKKLLRKPMTIDRVS